MTAPRGFARWAGLVAVEREGKWGGGKGKEGVDSRKKAPVKTKYVNRRERAKSRMHDTAVT